jgi:diguanylate cyclase (GGDEF)-like protein
MLLERSNPSRDVGALLLMDIDHFHVTNEQLGDAAGDELLCQVARGLRAWANRRGIVARVGGDEFAVAVTTTIGEDSHAIVSEARAAIAQACGPASPQFSVGVSIYDCRRPPISRTLLRCAEVALRDAKQAGDGHVIAYGVGEFYGADGAGWVARAIAEDRLTLAAQPIVDVSNNDIIRHELLVRASDADGQLVMPGRFIPTAERFGLMPALDRWVVTRALELAAEGNRVSVNLSAQSLADVTPLLEILEDFIGQGMRPSDLMFEVTETVAITDLRAGYQSLRALFDLGCPLALDDFGAGFGCFSYLKHIPAEMVKIDREFISDICRATTDLAITTAISRLVRELGIDAVAEGVEDHPTLAAVASAGVRYAQGYYLGRPGPIPRSI